MKTDLALTHLNANLHMVSTSSRKINNLISNTKQKNVVHFLMKGIAHMEIDAILFIQNAQEIIDKNIVVRHNLTLNLAQ